MGPESVETAAGDLGDQETHSGKITDGVTGTTETSDEDLVVLVNEGHATITGDEAGDSLIVFFELDSDTLSDTGVGLLGLNANLFDDDTTGVGGTLEGLSPLGSLVSLLVALVGPSVVSSRWSQSVNSNNSSSVTVFIFRLILFAIIITPANWIHPPHRTFD